MKQPYVSISTFLFSSCLIRHVIALASASFLSHHSAASTPVTSARGAFVASLASPSRTASSLRPGPHSHPAAAPRFPLFATILDKAEELYPSDDSGYAAAAASFFPRDTSADAATTAPSDRQPTKEATASDHFTTQLRLTPNVYDPFEVIADWVSDRFVDLSSRELEFGDDGDGLGVVNEEAYEPGSALDLLARASPRTPLSYQVRTLVRVVLPGLGFGAAGMVAYPHLVEGLVELGSPRIYDDNVLTVLSNDLSQYVQNILTTCALVFGMIVGQTYYFMYQQQEMVFYALFAEVTEAKSLLEQVSLMSAGRGKLYPSLLTRIDDYVRNDLKRLSVSDPTAVISKRPVDDPLESILYATSVGMPGSIYDTVMTLRQARAERCGALQRKLPDVHMVFLRTLAFVVLAMFPVCGIGSQAIDTDVLRVQAVMFGVLVFGLTLILNVVEELRSPRRGAYNIDRVLGVMVRGLESELRDRMSGKFRALGASPSLPGGARAWMAEEERRSGSDDVTGEISGGGGRGLIDDDAGGKKKRWISNSTVSRRSQFKQWLRSRVLRRS